MNRPLLIRGFYIDWDDIEEFSYLRGIGAVRGLSELYFKKPVTFLEGENGTGKSTLLEALACAYGFNPEGGTRNYSFSTYDSHSELHDAMRLIKGARKAFWGYYLRAESFYNVATKEEEYSRIQGVKMRLHEKSHGESFLYMMQHSFQKNGVYMMDEPEAALSPQRQLTLLAEIDRCVKEGSQFIIATHSPILLGFPDAQILHFDDEGIREICYEDTESFRITSLFLNDRKRIFHNLFEEEGED